MKKLFQIITIIIFFNSCQSDKTKIIEGDLYFKLIDYNMFYNLPDSVLTKIESKIASIGIDTLKEQDKISYNLINYMVNNNLLRKPFIRLRQDNGEKIMVFIDTTNYKKLSIYNHDKLISENKKIRIKAEVSELKIDSVTAYNTLKLLTIKKIDGKTLMSK